MTAPSARLSTCSRCGGTIERRDVPAGSGVSTFWQHVTPPAFEHAADPDDGAVSAPDVTAVPPRPAAPEVCRCGLPRGTAVHGNPFGAGHAYDPRPAAPDATAGDGLREFREQLMNVLWGDAEHRRDMTAKILVLPALRDVLAAAARDAEKVRRVESELDDLAESKDPADRMIVQLLSRALDGTA